jgi:hypothetical protein
MSSAGSGQQKPKRKRELANLGLMLHAMAPKLDKGKKPERPIRPQPHAGPEPQRQTTFNTFLEQQKAARLMSTRQR